MTMLCCPSSNRSQKRWIVELSSEPPRDRSSTWKLRFGFSQASSDRKLASSQFFAMDFEQPLVKQDKGAWLQRVHRSRLVPTPTKGLDRPSHMSDGFQ